MRFIKNKEQWKLNENLSAARKILKDNSIHESDDVFIKLKADLRNNLGFLEFYLEFLYF